MLPARIPKKAKRASRWRSQAHLSFVRSHRCCSCNTDVAIEAAHVRLGSASGISQKPDDWRAVSLCKFCHQNQHTYGERSFWKRTGHDPEALINEFIKASPKRREIEAIRKERGL